eukprot:153988-Chlamydomonas_euryale.AAC.4
MKQLHANEQFVSCLHVNMWPSHLACQPEAHTCCMKRTCSVHARAPQLRERCGVLPDGDAAGGLGGAGCGLSALDSPSVRAAFCEHVVGSMSDVTRDLLDLAAVAAAVWPAYAAPVATGKVWMHKCGRVPPAGWGQGYGGRMRACPDCQGVGTVVWTCASGRERCGRRMRAHRDRQGVGTKVWTCVARSMHMGHCLSLHRSCHCATGMSLPTYPYPTYPYPTYPYPTHPYPTHPYPTHP